MKKTVVLGLGVSGVAAAKFLLKQGIAVLGIDCNPLSEPPVGLCTQSDLSEVDWDTVERLVVSPGLSPKHPIYAQALAKKIPIVGEAELALPYFDKPLVAVTGTNGKTTVTYLVEHILNAVGIKARALGNVGSALCDYLMAPDETEAFVVELSSYQLETMATAVFDAALLLNITPDHLDRYTNMDEYARAKCRLQQLLKKGGSFFTHSRVVSEYGHLLYPAYEMFDRETEIEALRGIYYRHDYENALAAWALCRPFGVSKERFVAALQTFQKPPHRIEFVREREGVCFYDDSKGTNIDAVIQAVGAMKSSVVLIVGGVDKGASYLPWKEPFLGKVKEIIAIGQAAPKIDEELHPYFNINLADSLALAVEMAAALAKRGDSVLLSPGCSSFDCFRDYAHRGEEFQRCVGKL